MTTQNAVCMEQVNFQVTASQKFGQDLSGGFSELKPGLPDIAVSMGFLLKSQVHPERIPSGFNK